MNGRPWTEWEYAKVKFGIEAGKSHDAIGAEINRTGFAVRKKAFKRGWLKFKWKPTRQQRRVA